jgi:hypothetical protein
MEILSEVINSFLGWAFKEVFMEYHLHADNTETGGDEDAIEKKIDFIKSMQILHVKAPSNDRFMNDCYIEALQMHNNDGLTLVASVYFQFGLSLRKLIVNALPQQHIKCESDAYLKNARKHVQSQHEQVPKHFMHYVGHSSINSEESLSAFTIHQSSLLP